MGLAILCCLLVTALEVYGIVYLIRNDVNGKVYIGQTVQKLKIRWNQHASKARKGLFRPLPSSMRKHGEGKFTIVEVCKAYSKDELDSLETRAIWMNDSTNREFGYNLDMGGNTVGKMSESTKAKIGAANKISLLGKKQSPELIERRAAAIRGRKQSPEEIEARVVKMRGRKKSPEEVKRMSERSKAHYKANPGAAKKNSERALAMWRDKAYRETQMASRTK